MTENEAIEALRLINTSRVHPFYSWEEMAEVRDIAISSLKEVQQYRKIGTVEECKELASVVTPEKKHVLGQIVDEWKEYIEIGTVEECRDAVEKQKPKEPVLRNDNGKLRKSCQVCGCFFSPLSRSCPKCGQAILQENKDD